MVKDIGILKMPEYASVVEAKDKLILFVVNTPDFFLSHRLPLALAARDEGYSVHIATAADSELHAICDHGFTHHVIDFARSGQNPFHESKTLIQLARLFQKLQPDLVHLVTIKPVLYGGLAARWARLQSVVAAVSGLGTVFVASSTLGKFRRWLIVKLYIAAFRQKNLAVIFQNPDDRDTLLHSGCLHQGNVCMIRGSGVPLEDYPVLPEPQGVPVVVMAARLLKTKGVVVFVEAARLLKERGVAVNMRLIGSPDPGNPNSVTEEELNEWRNEGVVELMGFRRDIAEQYGAANIVCLPSFYGEGLPKCLVEAAACGRSVITTDMPGCRDAIEPGKSGALIPARDAKALADAIQNLVENPDKRREMGEAGRQLAERVFAIEKIVEQHMNIYKELLADG